MIPSVRKLYNEQYSAKGYADFLNELDQHYPGAIEFRLAETPVFVPTEFAAKMYEVCDHIIDLIGHPQFMLRTEDSIPSAEKVPGRYGYPQTLIFDFGVCTSNTGELIPMLIEMQGFPSLYAFQDFFPGIMKKHLPIPDGFTPYLGNLDQKSFREIFAKIILGNHAPENVVLLEIDPEKQKTKIDFYCTRDLTGIQPVCLSDLIREGKELYYFLGEKKTRINRIYNRLIFDELKEIKDLNASVDIRDELDVEWVPHPDWFYRLSKYTLPFLSHPYVPETWFLNEVKELRGDLADYVLKPLFSFAGQGVVIDVTLEDLDKIEDPQNWILQKKVKYADVIETPGEPAKAEIRMMYLWEENAPKPVPAINLARISKGKMIGTRYNKDKEWVGGTVALFPV